MDAKTLAARKAWPMGSLERCAFDRGYDTAQRYFPAPAHIDCEPSKLGYGHARREILWRNIERKRALKASIREAVSDVDAAHMAKNIASMRALANEGNTFARELVAIFRAELCRRGLPHRV